ncbi:MAG: TatD family hydrolase [Patescibacteria group bacterium]|jgi:TatD DNase family protein
MPPVLFDTHTHVNFQPFQADYKTVIQRALEQGIWLNNVSSQWNSAQRSIQIAEEYQEGVYATIGVHPIHLFQDVEETQTFGGVTQTIKARAEQFDPIRYEQLAKSSKKVIAIGECGLDYHHLERANLQARRTQLIQQQITVFKQHCDLALALNLPIVIHCRDAATHSADTLQAFEDVLTVLRGYNKKLRGVVHCYTGTAKYIPLFLELGLYIGYTGVITFPNAPAVQAAVRVTPLEKIVVETDAPYLAPVPMRGKRNEPSFVQYVAEAVASLKNIPLPTVQQSTTKNALELYRLS